MATKEMIADGLTKALPKQKLNNFVRMLGMENIEERVRTEKRMEELKEILKARKVDDSPENDEGPETEVRLT